MFPDSGEQAAKQSSASAGLLGDSVEETMAQLRNSEPMMTLAPHTAPGPAPALGVSEPVPVLGRIVLATTGAPTCRGVMLAGRELAARHGAHVSVVSVFHPRVPYPTPVHGRLNPTTPPSDRHSASLQLTSVRQQLAGLGVPTHDWALSFVAGHVGYRITELARSDHADLVVIGLGRSNASERGLGDRGGMLIAASVRAPLLAVAPAFDGHPRHVVIAVGKDDSPVHASRFAAYALPVPDRVTLVHVAEPASHGDARIEQQFRTVRRALGEWAGARLETQVLVGDPIEQLLAYSRHHDADLLVGGLHGGSFDERAIMRNSVLWVMALGDRSVLLVPDPRSRIQDSATRRTTVPPRVD
jgi:nucleotide-binding universal stress UspA family protein